MDSHQTMSSTLNDTPKFDNPPVIETVLGVQFKPLQAMRITQMGLLGEQIKDQFPRIEHRHQLEPVIESFDKPSIGQGGRWKISGEPELPRIWFISDESDEGQQLIQIQPDRFLFNWRRASLDNQNYPSYSKNKEEFKKWLRSFLDFIIKNDIGEFLPNQCEVTYVNHIIIEEGSSPGQMARACFPSMSGNHSDNFLPPEPEKISLNYSFRIKDNRGRLHVNVQPAIENKTGREILRFILTARGEPTPADITGVIDWLDLGHFWVVNGFKSFTDEDMHELWKVAKK